MKRRTYDNMVKATQTIVNKGYQWDEANDIAMKCFDQMEVLNNGMPVEWLIDKIQLCKQEAI